MAAEFIRVSARVRPSAKCSSSREVLSLDKTNVAIIASNNRLYQFDQVLDKDADQADVFKGVGKRIIDGALEGINGTVFAYGQTGSGKTHTMLGPAQEDGFFNDANQKGLMPRCLEYLFQQLEQTKAKIGPTFEYTVSCMFVELYNEAITDLLADNCPPVTIRAEAKNIVLQGATCEYATTFLEAMRLLQIGWDNRRVGETAMNKESSRSHAVLTIDVIQTEDHGCVINKREARINLVDLAGSERQSQSKASGVRLKEAAKINQSLGTLGRVIRELSSKGGHVPYRDSKLTLMIRDSLGGSSRTAVIVCVHPDEDYYVESLSTLKFAEDCRLVKNELHFNREVTGKSVAALQEKVLELELQLENASKQTIQQYEDRLRTIKEERDLFKLRLRELENKEVDDTIALYEPKSAFRTPAQKQRRRTRFTTPGQRNHLDATRAAQMPFWGDEEDKENSDLSLDKLLDLIRQLREEIKTLQSGNDESCALASSRLLIIEEITAAKSILEGEKAALERSFLKEQEENRELQRVNSELDTDLGYAKADITALNDKLSQATNDLESARLRIHELSAERDELTKALSQNAVLIQNKDKEIKEYQGIGKLLAAKNDQNKSLLAEFEKESHRLSDELAKTNTQLADKERLVKLTQDENRRLLKLDQERLSHEKTVEELKASMRDAEQQIYDLRETMDDRDVRIKSLEGACVDKEEEIARLKGENECLNTQLAETVGHKNPHQNTRWSKFLKVLGLKKIKMMQKYKDDAAKFRNDIQQLRSEKDRLEKELRRRAT